jgi:hypothetical protein
MLRENEVSMSASESTQAWKVGVPRPVIWIDCRRNLCFPYLGDQLNKKTQLVSLYSQIKSARTYTSAIGGKSFKVTIPCTMKETSTGSTVSSVIFQHFGCVN